ncbi:MAG: 3-phosphoshikimate 1-carboxyvinyltransferase, partial [Myxococcales bacterium]
VRGSRISGGVCDAHGDHRIAMAIAVAVLGAREEAAINGWSCVAKSYPGFFEDLIALGASVQ